MIFSLKSRGSSPSIPQTCVVRYREILNAVSCKFYRTLFNFIVGGGLFIIRCVITWEREREKSMHQHFLLVFAPYPRTTSADRLWTRLQYYMFWVFSPNHSRWNGGGVHELSASKNLLCLVYTRQQLSFVVERIILLLMSSEFGRTKFIRH